MFEFLPFDRSPTNSIGIRDNNNGPWRGRIAMIARMVTRSTLPAGSVGSVETRFLDLPAPLALDCGRGLRGVRVAYETYGALSPERDNVILVCHALSGDAHAAGYSTAAPAAST